MTNLKNTVLNVPAYAWEEENSHWVVTEDDGDLWFYGAYSTGAEACRVAMSQGKRVIE